MRLAIGVMYLGTPFWGWQEQSSSEKTVQAVLEKALSRVANSPIKIFCAGRTDRGVHAVHQVVHFDTNSCRSESAWVFGSNSYLPSTISVLWAKVVPDTFHARFSARSRTYKYIILNHKIRYSLAHQTAYWRCKPLNAASMMEASRYLLGEHDFSAFRSSECQSRTPNRFVQELTIGAKKPWVQITCKANAFLHHMVRNIVGSLLLVGANERSPEWLQEVLLSRDRTKAGPTAPAQGLYLADIEYPAIYEIPHDICCGSVFPWI